MIDKTVAPIRATFSALTFVKPTLSDLSQPGEAHMGGKLDGCTTTRGTKTPAMKGLLGVTIRSHIYLSFIYHIFFRYSCLYWAFHLVKVMKTVTGCQVFCKKKSCLCQFLCLCVSIFLLMCVNFFTRVCQFFCLPRPPGPSGTYSKSNTVDRTYCTVCRP
jgi:hypothetical protein